jgi:hypothetical protein
LLAKIADDCFEESEYLIKEIQMMVGDTLDDNFLKLFKLAN